MSDIIPYAMGFTTLIMGFALFIDKLYPPIRYDKNLKRLSLALCSFNVFMLAIIDGLKYNQRLPFFRIYQKISDYNLEWLLLSTLIYVIVTDCLLWLQHRLFHTKILYKWFHYFHHKFAFPAAYDFAAAHPIDILALYFSYHIVTLFMPVYAITIYIYAIVSNIAGIFYHGQGLHLIKRYVYNVDTEFHNVHHIKHSCNYGAGIFPIFWDKLFGTYKYENQKIPQSVKYEY